MVAAVLKKSADTDEYLTVKRPTDDRTCAATGASLKPGELPEAGALRICREKLNCKAKPLRFLGIMFQKRNSYDMFLMDVEMELMGDRHPDIHQAKTQTTANIEQKWTNDPMDLMESARHGSCCSSIFLTDRGLLDRDQCIASLEGSNLVA